MSMMCEYYSCFIIQAAIGQLARLEKEFIQKEGEMKKQHESEIAELKQELFSLSVKVKIPFLLIRVLNFMFSTAEGS